MKEKTLPSFFKSFAFFLAACLVGILPNAGNLLTTNEYGKLSNRGKAELTINPDMQSNKAVLSGGLDKDYATRWSYGVGETFSFLIPSFKGGGNKGIAQADQSALKKVDPEYRQMVGSSDVYFGDQPMLSAPDYLGAFVVLLAVIGLFIIRNPLKWPLFFVTLLAIMLGWGHNFMGLTSFFMDHVPGYNKFRAVSMIMIIPELTVPLLAIMALSEMTKFKSWEQNVHLQLWNKDVKLKKLILVATAVVGGFCAISYLVPDVVNTFHSAGEEEEMTQRFVRAGYPADQAKLTIAELLPQIESARKAVFRSDAMRSLIFILLGLGTVYLYFTNRIKKELLFASLGVFILIDLWTVDRRYLDDKSFISKSENQEYISGKTAADEEILKDPDPDYRVLNLTVGTFDDASTSFYHKSIGGYHGAKLRRYVDLIEFHISPEINIFYQNINEASRNDSSLAALFSRLRVLNMLNTKYLIMPVGEEGDKAIPVKNPEANGHAWLVKNLRLVQTPDSEIVGMQRINTRTEAIANEKFKSVLPLKENYSGEGSVRLQSYQPNHLVYKTDTKSEEFAVFSEIYYEKGWNAYVDGNLKPHMQVNYVLRGMNIPSGQHTVEFKFEPATYRMGNTLALIGSVLLLVTIAGGFYLHGRNKVIVS